MKLKLSLLSFFLFLPIGLAVDDKAPNEVITTYCGVNTLEGSWVGEVCLAQVDGFRSLEVLQTRHTNGDVVVAPIVRRTVKKNSKRLSIEQFEVTTGEALEKNGRVTLETHVFTLTIRNQVKKGEPVETRVIQGSDGKGRPFQANLEGRVLAQVGGELE